MYFQATFNGINGIAWHGILMAFSLLTSLQRDTTSKANRDGRAKCDYKYLQMIETCRVEQRRGGGQREREREDKTQETTARARRGEAEAAMLVGEGAERADRQQGE